MNQILKKGQPVFVEGRIQTRNWEGQDGVKRYKTEIVSENVIALGARGGYSGGESEVTNPVEVITKTDKKDKKEEKEIAEDEIDIEDIPF